MTMMQPKRTHECYDKHVELRLIDAASWTRKILKAAKLKFHIKMGVRKSFSENNFSRQKVADLVIRMWHLNPVKFEMVNFEKPGP